MEIIKINTEDLKKLQEANIEYEYVNVYNEMAKDVLYTTSENSGIYDIENYIEYGIIDIENEKDLKSILFDEYENQELDFLHDFNYGDCNMLDTLEDAAMWHIDEGTRSLSSRIVTKTNIYKEIKNKKVSLYNHSHAESIENKKDIEASMKGVDSLDMFKDNEISIYYSEDENYIVLFKYKDENFHLSTTEYKHKRRFNERATWLGFLTDKNNVLDEIETKISKHLLIYEIENF